MPNPVHVELALSSNPENHACRAVLVTEPLDSMFEGGASEGYRTVIGKAHQVPSFTDNVGSTRQEDWARDVRSWAVRPDPCLEISVTPRIAP